MLGDRLNPVFQGNSFINNFLKKCVTCENVKIKKFPFSLHKTYSSHQHKCLTFDQADQSK